MRIASYHRTSTTDQNPTLARDELRAAASRLGTLVMEVEETGSGARNSRPGLQQVMQAARKGQVDCVICWKLDRWGRSALDVLSNIRALESAGVRFVCTTQGLDVRPDGDATSRLLLQVLAAVAEFERDLIRERTIAGLARARKHGTRSGKAIGGQSSLPPGGAEQVKKLREAGMSWSQLAREVGVSVWAARRAVARIAVISTH